MVARLIEFLWDKALYGRVTTPLLDFSERGLVMKLLRLLNALICSKEVEASSFSLWRYSIYIQYCCSEFGPAGSVGCVARVPSIKGLALIAQPLFSSLVPRLSSTTMKFW